MIDEKKYVNVNFFNFLLKIAPIKKGCNLDFLFKVYCLTMSNIIKQINSNQVLAHTSLLNPLSVWNYIVSEYMYTSNGVSEEEIKGMDKNENLIAGMSNVCVDKYLILEHLTYNMPNTANKYYPPLSSVDLYLTHILHTLNNLPKNMIPTTLMNDIYYKYFSMAHCIVSLLANGYETEALATWRTLHETECIIIILDKYPEAYASYIKHMRYNLAYRNSIVDIEEQNQIFVELKKEMKELGLKSKDMKRFIENGWLFAIPGVKEDEHFKINFRQGIEYVAGLEDLNEWYEISSEIAHGSPLLVYSDKTFFFNMSLIGLLQSFVRIEEIFSKSLLKGCDEITRSGYISMRETRLVEIKRILEMEEKSFESKSEALIHSIYSDNRLEEDIDKNIE